MALVPAICPQCGGKIEVDDAQEAGICKFCGTPFITEKAINNYITNYTTNYKVTENVTKIVYGQEKDDSGDYFKRGMKLLSAEEYSGAFGCFFKAADLAVDNGEYWFYTALTAQKLGKSEYFGYVEKFYKYADEGVRERLLRQTGARFPKDRGEFEYLEFCKKYVRENQPLSGSWDFSFALKALQESYRLEFINNYLSKLVAQCGVFPLEEELPDTWQKDVELLLPFFGSEQEKRLSDAANPVFEGVLYIRYAPLMRPDFISGKTMRITDVSVRGVKMIDADAIYGADTFVISENITKCIPVLRRLVFEAGTEDRFARFIAACTEDKFYSFLEVVVLPDGFDGNIPAVPVFVNEKNPPSFILVADKSKNMDKLFFIQKDREEARFYPAYVADGKIHYPKKFPLKDSCDFGMLYTGINVHLQQWFGEDIKSGKLKNYVEGIGNSAHTVQNSKCYIASCVYGSYDCPQVWVLRRYRDKKLSRTAAGRLFIRIYYALSPKAVLRFGGNARFRRFFMRLLDRKVARLRKKGIADNPYNDPPASE